MKALLLLTTLFPFVNMVAQQVTDSVSKKPVNLTVMQFKEKTLRSDKLVLVNLQADWCIVCKKEKPILDQIEKEFQNQVELIEIDLDDNPLIAEYFEVDGLPVNLLYKNGTMIWNRMGIVNKDDVAGMIKAALSK